jgi:macrolide transport system ATP-binding/permease protein
MHLLRTIITLLGIIIGVSAVIVMLAVGNGSKQKIVQQMSAMGTNLLMVMPGAPGLRGAGDVITLTPADATEIEGVENISSVVPERRARFTTRYGNLDYATVVQGVGASFPEAREWGVAKGAFFTQQDVTSNTPVAVIGETVFRILFPPGANPVGEYIVIGNVPFQVIGVLSPKGASPMGSDQDDVVIVPLSTGLVRLFGRSYLSTITVKVTDLKKISDTQDNIREILLSRHRTEDFNIRNMASIIATTTETQNTLTILLASVAAISLLVGGIGVMNIMLVSVTERTREIGIRVATGAEQKDILLQFNIESAVICGIGGVIGIALGFGIGLLLKASGLSIIFTVFPPIIAFLSAFLTGVLFGYLPAKKASQMNPVLALATE